jgi:hypothetical protein
MRLLTGWATPQHFGAIHGFKPKETPEAVSLGFPTFEAVSSFPRRIRTTYPDVRLTSEVEQTSQSGLRLAVSLTEGDTYLGRFSVPLDASRLSKASDDMLNDDSMQYVEYLRRIGFEGHFSQEMPKARKIVLEQDARYFLEKAVTRISNQSNS